MRFSYTHLLVHVGITILPVFFNFFFLEKKLIAREGDREGSKLKKKISGAKRGGCEGEEGEKKFCLVDRGAEVREREGK